MPTRSAVTARHRHSALRTRRVPDPGHQGLSRARIEDVEKGERPREYRVAVEVENETSSGHVEVGAELVEDLRRVCVGHRVDGVARGAIDATWTWHAMPTRTTRRE